MHLIDDTLDTGMDAFKKIADYAVSFGVNKQYYSTQQRENIKRYGASAMSFLFMHVVYFPLLSSCLIMNYMVRNGFFNYDIISSNFFAISISTTLLMIMLGFLALIMWSWFGYQFLVYRGITTQDNSINFILVVLNLVMIVLMSIQLISGSNKSAVITSGIISMVIMIFYCCYFTSPLRVRIIMIGALTGLTAFFIFMYGEYSASLFGKALRIFGIGGDREISIAYTEKSYDIHYGKLVLLTPDFVYYRENGNIMIVPMQSIKHLAIAEKIKKQ